MNPKRRSLRFKDQTDADPTMTNNNLPEEFIAEHILSRLPVKSLLQFCCVSKRWRSIISDPVFAKTHFRMASQQKTLSHKLLLANSDNLRSLDLGATASFGKKSCLRKLTNPFKYPMKIRYVVGSVNGLLCLEVKGIIADKYCKHFYIWNPSIGFIIKLPDYRSVLPAVDVKDFMYWGFGYASATDDYKVLIILQTVNGEQYCLMFSSRYKCWKKVGDPRLSIWNNNPCLVRMGCYSNEALHWVQTKNENENENEAVKYAIVAFDMATEEFREVPLPMNNNDGVQRCVWAEVLSEILGGCLSITSREELAEFNWVVTVWVMREYGVQHSWSKLFKIGCRDESWKFPLYETILVVCEENGTIVLKGQTLKYFRCNHCYEIVRFDFKENMCDGFAVSSRWRDMVLVPQEKWNFDNFVVRTDRRYGCGSRYMFRYDESLLKIQL